MNSFYVSTYFSMITTFFPFFSRIKKPELKCVLLLLGIVFFLNGCSTSNKTPVTGLCGSCKPYYARGSMYYPQNYYEYDEVGLASWYGPGFHGKPKPLGEKYNQHAMTAAHATLPLPTIAKVTNLANGKSVIVLVDDRGPFVYDGRIIDLSMEAAKRLGTFQKGVSKVRVQSLIDESKALSDYLAKNGHHMRKDRLKRTWLEIYEQEIKKIKTPAYDNTSITAPVSSTVTAHADYVTLSTPYSSKAAALKASKKIGKAYPLRLLQSMNGQKKPVWRIQVGPFAKAQSKQKVALALKNQGLL